MDAVAVVAGGRPRTPARWLRRRLDPATRLGLPVNPRRARPDSPRYAQGSEIGGIQPRWPPRAAGRINTLEGSRAPGIEARRSLDPRSGESDFWRAGRAGGLRSAGEAEEDPGSIMSDRPRVEIEYCTQCRWLLRAAWMAQELLTTFESELGGVSLVPGAGAVFDVRIDGEVLWSREEKGRFP